MSRAWGDPHRVQWEADTGPAAGRDVLWGKGAALPSTHLSHRSQTVECQLLPCRLWGRHSTRVHIPKMRLWHQAQPAAAEGGEEGTQTQWQAGAGLHRAAVLGQVLQHLKVAPGDCSQWSWPRQQHREGMRGAHHCSPRGTAVGLGLSHSRAPTSPRPPGGAGCAQQVLLSHHCFTARSTRPHHGHQALPSAPAPTQPQWCSRKATVTLLPPSPFKSEVPPFPPHESKLHLYSHPCRPGSVHRRRLVALGGIRGLGEGRLLVAVVADVGVTGVRRGDLRRGVDVAVRKVLHPHLIPLVGEGDQEALRKAEPVRARR